MSHRKHKLKEDRSLQSRFAGETGIFREIYQENKSKIVKNQEGIKKLSECIIELVEPYSTRYPDRFKAVIQMGISAWNLSLFPERKNLDILEKMFSATIPFGETPQIVKFFIDDLKKRKSNLFPNDKRFILDYEIIENGSDITLNVVSSAKNKKI